ncbi:PREDICTED: galactosylceramide sulfotransferase-like [Priapulus caudatus]|uniref:Galactosylceramide sulfotransferase-like n=1 Tax=Priapulus caudatus TaxID=37621 RepID=A0ABM1EAY0_PRICU|nr:PREDICTED: galactosylceramide sulfotransferase-like [Priapulus caudatus]
MKLKRKIGIVGTLGVLATMAYFSLLHLETTMIVDMRRLFRSNLTFATTCPSMQVRDDVTVTSRRPARTCEEVQHVVFAKTHKCGSDTLAIVFMRFADERNLTIMLPTGEWNLNWPGTLRKGVYHEPETRYFDVLTLHTVYNRSTIAPLFPPDTKHVTILREPYAQFASAFNYFGVGNKMKTTKNVSSQAEKFELFLSDPDSYLKQHYWPHLPNFMSFDLGFKPTTNHTGGDARRFVRNVVADFDLVMIMEYYHESLVLLRRRFCWHVASILFITKNKSWRRVFASAADRERAESLRALYARWSPVDIALYAHFNASLWESIAKEKSFAEEVWYFTELNQRVSVYCQKVIMRLNPPPEEFNVPESPWDAAFNVTSAMCARMRRNLLAYIASEKAKAGLNKLVVPTGT